jgi:hypothetical protein
MGITEPTLDVLETNDAMLLEAFFFSSAYAINCALASATANLASATYT